ncbi:MAG: helix-turn-helix domain-containing protein [Saprospirales bacterium]|nr:helix-turn-helix domain-containing protein [Saprospirales bacterium]
MLRWLGCCRFVYNLCLEHRIVRWQSGGGGISEYDQNKELAQVKQSPGCEWLFEVHSQVLQDVVRRVRHSFDRFFSGRGIS